MSTLISCHGLTASYGARPLFSDLSLNLHEGDRLGIIGPNGAGKSTLLALLAGAEPPLAGDVLRRKGLTVGQVEQVPEFDEALSVRAILEASLAAIPLAPLEQESERVVRVEIMLERLCVADPDQPVGQLSGGWQKRLAIGVALITEPDLLLLDEPTNHLDLEGILWLEQLLRRRREACVVISHDRTFLEQVATRMLQLDPRFPAGAFAADGAYSRFIEQREEFLAQQSKTEASLASKVRREVEWLRRGPKARTTKAAGRQREAERLIEELNSFKGRRAAGTAGIDFSSTGRKTRRLLAASALACTLGGRELFSGVDLLLQPRLRLGLVGPNGSGKTSLLRLLADELQPTAGKIKRADGLRVVYFDQQREQLDGELALRRALSEDGDRVIYRGNELHVVSWAKRFLFKPEQLDSPLRALSGGEQAKVLIARLMLQPADLLLLDEPTNDLDLPTLEVLEESLLDFPGAVVLVTHDRFLLDRVSTLLLGLDGRGGANLFADLAQWERWIAERNGRGNKKGRTGEGKARRRRKRKGLTSQEKNEHRLIEASIEAAEIELEATRPALEDPAIAADAVKLQECYATHEAARTKVETLYRRWEELEQKLAQAREEGD